MLDRIKVLVVDDSSLVRKIVTDILEKDPVIKVVGTANNGKTAIFKNRELNPDVITLDIEMPILNGLEALKDIMENNPKPVIMMSVLTQHGAEATFKALDYGAVDFIPKPSSVLSLSVDEIGELLRTKVKAVCRSRVNLNRRVLTPAQLLRKSEFPESSPVREAEVREEKIPEVKRASSKIVGIGTSTGGPSALLNVFKKIPENFPSPIVVVQHMPEGFTRAFSERLDSSSSLNVKEAEDGDKLSPGCGYIAPGHSHIIVERDANGWFIRLDKGEKVSGHRPSIDVLFDSLARTSQSDTVAVIMTGMGRDGAEGINKIRETGGYTLAQNEETSVVYGMNRVAVEKGAIKEVVSLDEITKKIVEHI
ncbi:MAG: chemotaxis response regulator protein-glutamate methylesterase [bacterium]|nr:chemotaxis response regulator protein-glutamate methylesterase [bacterium]